MYLLNQDATSDETTFKAFTFHYVSIKSEWVERDIKEKLHLHSTMYLLNLYSRMPGLVIIYSFTFHYVSIKSKSISIPAIICTQFTFHYVSIKSFTQFDTVQSTSNLHSTMYLLNLRRDSPPSILIKYLHSTMYLLNLSILMYMCILITFTFHYVSIKSCRHIKEILNCGIYIPLCIY